MSRPLTLAQACARFQHRFTMEHVPSWAKQALPGHRRATDKPKFYAPQFRTDSEWYASTVFPGEAGYPFAGEVSCYTSGQTWPLGEWLAKPYRIR